MRRCHAKPDRVSDRALARSPRRMRRWNSQAFVLAATRAETGALGARGFRLAARFCVSCLWHQQELLGEMARDLPGAEAAQFWHRGLAHSGAQRATAVEAANIRIGIDRAARLAGQPQPPGAILMQTRHGGNQRLGIGMQRTLEDFRGRDRTRRSCRDTSPAPGRTKAAPRKDRATRTDSSCRTLS